MDELRKKYGNKYNKIPFSHQSEAFNALNKTFYVPSQDYRAGLLVLPTGAGKTFTAVNWLSKYVISKGIRVLWLAQSSILLDQAFEAFRDNAINISPERQSLNIRVVSGSPKHHNVFSIAETDDVVIITTHSAINHFNACPLDKDGNQIQTQIKKFVENNSDASLFVVLDEAHHAPAYGCRNLLLDITKLVPSVNILGLTATPTYTDEKKRGWLFKIFEQKIIYEAKQANLIAQNILAIPNYIEKSTGTKLGVDDKLYDRLVRQHKDLPESIIEKIARDSARNNYIVNDYVAHKNIYGKTIIFSDRWFQCLYLRDKLIEKGIRAEAVFSRIDADPGTPEARNRRTSSDNERIIQEFRENKYDVLVNVRMLAEGTDIPDCKTVFITRQTTSSILLTQMIGRALRGKKAGGGNDKGEANIVLFIDDWKRVINWAKIEGGKTEDSRPIRGYFPMQIISFNLVEKLIKQIDNNGIIDPTPFLQFIPVGWFLTNISVNTSDGINDEMQTFDEFVMVYEKTKDKFDSFMGGVFDNLPQEWADEKLDENVLKPHVDGWLKEYFDQEQDDIGGMLEPYMIKIVRHIAQNGEKPDYFPFTLRDDYDLDKLAKNLCTKDFYGEREILQYEFNRSGSLWKVFYRDYYLFKRAVDEAKITICEKERNSPSPPDTVETVILEPDDNGKVPPEWLRKQVIARDGSKCLCCGRSGRGVKLEIDHIIPYSIGGKTVLENLQTLCSVCNKNKSINEINFRDIHSSTLKLPKNLELLTPHKDENPKYTMTRIVNFFYHCQAVIGMTIHVKSSGSHYYKWKIELYAGNNPEWLKNQRKKLITFIHDELGWTHVKDLIIECKN